MQTAAGGDDRGDDRDLPVAPAERPVAARVQDLAGRDHEVDPPQAERQPDAGERDERGVDRPARALRPDDRGERRDRADDPLAERDDDEQPVALGDVVRVPRRAALAALGDVRAGELDQDRAAPAQTNVSATVVCANSSASQPTWAIEDRRRCRSGTPARRSGFWRAARDHWKTIATRITT